jgi:ribose transport system substrate-binding protein
MSSIPTRALLALFLVAALAVAACGSTDSGTARKEVKVSTENVESSSFKGPNGESASPASSVKLSAAEVKKVQESHFTAALAWHDIDQSIVAADKGIKDRFKELGIEVVTDTDADFDAGKQRDQYEAALAKKPDALITLPVDADAAAVGLKPAVDQGVKIVFQENIASGFKPGKDYVTTVSIDYNSAAEKVAEILAKSLGGKGKLGYLFHDADYFITNQWDKHFKETIEKKYPGIEIVAEAGFADPYKTEDVANAMLTRHPDLDAMYATWMDPLEGVLTAVRASGRADQINIAGVGMSEQIALDMAKGGPVVGMGGITSYEQGKVMADAVACSLLGKKVPPLVVTPGFAITKSNLATGYKKMYGIPAPDSVLTALGE